MSVLKNFIIVPKTSFISKVAFEPRSFLFLLPCDVEEEDVKVLIVMLLLLFVAEATLVIPGSPSPIFKGSYFNDKSISKLLSQI